jgi:hypothetical protein
VTVPHKDPIPTGTPNQIAKQAGADDFGAFREWIDRTA